jgi:hypothetical protein
MNDTSIGPPSMPVDVRRRVERVALPPERVAQRADGDATDRAWSCLVEFVGQQDHPRAGPEHRQPGVDPCPDGIQQLEALEQLADRRRLAAGQDEPVDLVELSRTVRTSRPHGAAPRRARRCSSTSPCSARTPTRAAGRVASSGDPDPPWRRGVSDDVSDRANAARARRHQPRSAYFCHRRAVHLDADHRLAEAPRHLGDDLRVLEVRRRLDDRASTTLGVAGLEDARADEHAVRAQLHHHRGVRRRRDPPGGEQHHRQAPELGDFRTRSSGACRFFAAA